MVLQNIIEKGAKKYPRKIAIIYKGEEYTYQQLWEKVEHFANGLTKLNRKEKIGILLKNCPEYVISYFSILKSGNIVIPLNHLLAEEEIEYIFENAEVSSIITSTEFLPKIVSIQKRIKTLTNIILVDKKISGTIFFDELLLDKQDNFKIEIDTEDIAAILYTSGTTGYSKGVMLTHKNILSDVIFSLKALPVTEKDRFLCILPMFHSFTTTVCIVLPLYIGASIFVVEGTKHIKKLISDVIKYRVSIFVGVPSIYKILSEINPPKFLKIPFIRKIMPIRFCISGAAKLPVEVIENFQKKFHIPLLEGYGLTETSPAVSINPLGKQKIGSVGIPLPGVEVKIVDEKGEEVEVNKEGEIIVKGDIVMKGYYKLKEETEKTIVNGWIYTGDIGKIDEEGYLWILDRKKDMINVRGLNVYPSEIERVLLQHPKISEACVIGVGDYFKGEVPKAFIVVKKGEQLKEKEVLDFLKTKIASYKIPKYIEFIDFLPKSSTGKILKRQLQGGIWKK